jgi:hypothetical protein
MKRKLASEQRKTKKQDKQLIVAKAKLEESQAETEKEKKKYDSPAGKHEDYGEVLLHEE